MKTRSHHRTLKFAVCSTGCCLLLEKFSWWLLFGYNFEQASAIHHESAISYQPKYAAITKMAMMQQLIDFCQSGQIYWLSDKCPFKPKHLHKVCWSVIVHKVCEKFLTSNQTAAFVPISLLLKNFRYPRVGECTRKNLLPRQNTAKIAVPWFSILVYIIYIIRSSM